MEELNKNMSGLIDKTRINNSTLAGQGESILAMGDTHERINSEINKASRQVSEIQMNAYKNKLILRAIAALLTFLNVMMLFRKLFG